MRLEAFDQNRGVSLHDLDVIVLHSDAPCRQRNLKGACVAQSLAEDRIRLSEDKAKSFAIPVWGKLQADSGLAEIYHTAFPLKTIACNCHAQTQDAGRRLAVQQRVLAPVAPGALVQIATLAYCDSMGRELGKTRCWRMAPPSQPLLTISTLRPPPTASGRLQ